MYLSAATLQVVSQSELEPLASDASARLAALNFLLGTVSESTELRNHHCVTGAQGLFVALESKGHAISYRAAELQELEQYVVHQHSRYCVAHGLLGRRN